MNIKSFYLLLLIFLTSKLIIAQTSFRAPISSTKPNKYQLAQIDRKYGMFIHFGINTFWNEEWTDGSKPASSYKPTGIDADQWVIAARNAGMKYVILVCKHHDGFCLWDSKYTNYDIASSGNKTDVVEAVAKACRKYHIRMGVYYSLWDRRQNADVEDTSLDKAYNTYLVNQIKELINISSKYTKVVEIWLDGGWVKKNTRWPLTEIYETVKKREPQCQIGVNWSIGSPQNPDSLIHPDDQKNGYPIRYFPSDFRLGDPYLPAIPDPKLFTYNNKEYYMPWESTICISQKWFYNTQDTIYKTPQELLKLYKAATAQNNILILDLPPDTAGKLRKKDIQLVYDLRKLTDNK